MLGCQDFCGYYDWTFHYIRRRWGNQALARFMSEAIGEESQSHYSKAAAAGLSGLLQWEGTHRLAAVFVQPGRIQMNAEMQHIVPTPRAVLISALLLGPKRSNAGRGRRRFRHSRRRWEYPLPTLRGGVG